MPRSLRFPDVGEAILVGGSRLLVAQLLRLLPNRRLACRGRWKDKKVFVKIFANSFRGKMEWEKEHSAFSVLRKKSIDIPELLYFGVSDDGAFRVLVAEWIEDACTIQEAWVGDDFLADQVALLLARQHKAGIAQIDLHPENLLLKDSKLFTIDCARITHRSKSIGKDGSFNNLALLLIQLHPMNERIAQRVLRKYVEYRGWDQQENDWEYFLKFVRRALLGIRRRTRRKLFRNCTSFLVVRSRGWRWVYDRSLSYGDKLTLDYWQARLPSDFRSRQEKWSGQTGRVSVADEEGRGLVVMPFHVRPRLPFLRGFGGYTQSEKSWINGQLLSYQGLSLEYPVAHIWKPEGPFSYRGIICAEERKGISIDQFLMSNEVARDEKQKVIQDVFDSLLYLQWLMVSPCRLDGGIYVDEGGPYFRAPFDIVMYKRHAHAYTKTAEVWRSFVSRFARDQSVLDMFEVLEYGK